MAAASAFRVRARKALGDARLKEALRRSTERTMAARRAALAELAEMAVAGWAAGDFAALRARARAAKQEILAHLDRYLDQATRAIQAAGGTVHMAADGAEVARIVRRLAEQRGVRLAVKSKSMATEEIHLNAALAQAGLEVVETDLGEFIIQLAGETPSHIVAPVIHKNRQQIADLFGKLVGRPLTTDTPTLTAVARRVLREKFLAAGMGISGANFLVAETGTLVLVTNEGNGRMVTSLPPLHVAVVGVEKLVPRLQDLPVFLNLLARSATGQKISVYTHLVTGPRHPAEADGPEELHVIFLDNGRRRLREGPYQELLHCIRCGACLNHCPVYQEVGGHAYGAVYSGPIGTALMPQLGGLADWRALPAEACSLCAACTEVCPVGIPLHDLILRERADVARQGLDTSGLGAPLGAVARLWSHPAGFGWSLKAARVAMRRLPLERLPGPLRAWTQGRDFPDPPPLSFRELWERRRTAAAPTGPGADAGPRAAGAPDLGPDAAAGPGTVAHPDGGFGGGAGVRHDLGTLRARFAEEVGKLGARCDDAADGDDVVRLVLEAAGAPAADTPPPVLLWDDPLLVQLGIGAALQAAGFPVVRSSGADAAATAQVGVTTARLAVAGTGTLVLAAGPGQPRATSLLPWVHVAVVPETALVATVEEATERLAAAGGGLPSSVVLITGPSRSADIENDLSIGVHGPGVLRIVLLRSA